MKVLEQMAVEYLRKHIVSFRYKSFGNIAKRASVKMMDPTKDQMIAFQQFFEGKRDRH